MLWPASVLGAVAGFVLASVPGALLGGALGYGLDRRLELADWADLRQRLGQHAAEQLDGVLLMHLLGAVAAAGVARPDAQRRALLREARRAGLNETLALAAFARGQRGARIAQALEQLQTRPARRDTVLRAAWRMAWAGDCCAPPARALLGRWAAQLGCSAEQLAELEAAALGWNPPAAERDPDFHAALALLGVSADSPPATVKRAYRRLLSRHHPDKLGGADAVRLASATETTRRLHAAWQLVRQRQDWH